MQFSSGTPIAAALIGIWPLTTSIVLRGCTGRGGSPGKRILQEPLKLAPQSAVPGRAACCGLVDERVSEQEGPGGGGSERRAKLKRREALIPVPAKEPA